jgi:hypothetical protein
MIVQVPQMASDYISERKSEPSPDSGFLRTQSLSKYCIGGALVCPSATRISNENKRQNFKEE